ncbi:hypothetical protein Tsubulata_031541 [Turnera subulata]|uniref:WIT1/2 N-terminal helical bundle domain-containing protein n=1 Tax=Turnera subulata TaxID=218843 RepID=A0A9Q0J692_9ROSI|nr:hypothetical protein Tsubulata_031541 [Turnera subulata]
MEELPDNSTPTIDPETDMVPIEQQKEFNEEQQEVESSTMELLSSIELDLASSCEKLTNLHVLLMQLLAWDDNLEETAKEDSYISATSIEKTLVFDLLCGILDSEVGEVQNFLDNIQVEINNARHKVLSCRCTVELASIMEQKLQSSEESLKKTQEDVLELKMQSAKLRNTFSAFRLENWQADQSMDLLANGRLLNINIGSKRLTPEKQKHILRMLEKSLERELELEKKMSEQGQREEQLKLKLHHTEQVAFRMEEAAEVVWGRFLEAENASEVLMGISKELVGRLQVVQFNLNGSFQREHELKSKLQHCFQLLDAKDAAIKKLENSLAEHITKSSEVPDLKERIKSLEEQLRKSELLLENAESFNQENQEQLVEMENIVEALKESNYDAESRAENAEAKVTQLTDTNMELNEEITFLKGSRDSDAKKVTLLEKQLRELEIQLQHAKVSSEASQEQQNMLYSAIWDMETLIEDLKSKVAKAESKTETSEEQCIELSEMNLELNAELSFLKVRVEDLEASLEEAKNSKAASAKEINLRNKLIMDTVRQLASERERIQNQLCSLTKENEELVKKLRSSKRDASVIVCNNLNGSTTKLCTLENDSSKDACGTASQEETTMCKSLEAAYASAHCSNPYGSTSRLVISSENSFGFKQVSSLPPLYPGRKVDKEVQNRYPDETNARNSYSTSEGNEGTPKLEAEKAGHISLKAIFAVLLAAVFVYLLHKKHVFQAYFNDYPL